MINISLKIKLVFIHSPKGIDTEEFERALATGNDYRELNNGILDGIARKIINSTQSLSYQDILTQNYLGLDLDKHGYPHLAQDLRLLLGSFLSANNIVSRTTENRSKSVFFMGEGPGRTAIPAIEIARNQGIESIVFNDLMPWNVEKIRERIRNVYNTDSDCIEGVNIYYEEGDFFDLQNSLKQKYPKGFDMLFAMWFVTSEECEISSIDALSQKRSQLYKNIHSLLSKQGVFIEDVPYSEGVGNYYYLLRLKTSAVLQKLGILSDESANFILTGSGNYQDENSGSMHPELIRYAPPNGIHAKEVKDADFSQYSEEISLIPDSIYSNSRAIYDRELGNDIALQSLFEGTSFSDLQKLLANIENNYLYSSVPEELQKIRKTILWRKVHP